MPDVLVAGETLIDFLPERPGALADVAAFSRRPGGAPANVAVALARLDERPWFWTRVGDDPFGDFLVETLDEHGLPDRFVERDPDAKTSLAFVAHDAAGDPEFSFYRDGTADTRFEPGRVPAETLAAVDWVVVGGVLLASEPSRSAIRDLAARAREHGCTVVFDPNARPELWREGAFAAAVGVLLEHVDVVKATPEELRVAGFDGDGERELARAVHERGPHTVLLTRGSAGAFARATADAPWGPVEVEHGGYDVEVVDATGAGDAFLAGAVAALAHGESLESALSFANAVAALATTGEGAMTALPDRAAVAELRDQR